MTLTMIAARINVMAKKQTYSTLEALDLIAEWTGVLVSDTQLRHHCFRKGAMAPRPAKVSGNLRWTKGNVLEAMRILGLKRKRK